MFSFSIVLPVRNGGAYFKLCVNSILAQEHDDFELLILDNQSTDGSFEWAQALGDKRITMYRSDGPLTIEKNWARATTVPRKEFMTLIGHDDILAPHYLAEMESLVARHPKASLYQSHFRYINKEGALNRLCLPMDQVQSAPEFLACQMNGTINSTGTGYVFRSADFDQLGGMPSHYPNLIFADYHLWISLARLSYKATSLRECFEYREHESVSRNTDGVKYHRAFVEYATFLTTLKAEKDFDTVITRYGRKMLLEYAQSLSHRLLKTPVSLRSMRVADLIREFETIAIKIIPGQDFRPLDQPRTKLARDLDRSRVGRQLFGLYKKLTRKSLSV